MSITNILVAYNGLPASEAALAGAVRLRDHYGAHLTGLYAHGGSRLSHHIKPWMPEKVKSALMEIETDSGATVARSFRAATGGVPDDRLHWIDSAEAPNSTVAAYARLFDITVVGLHEHAEGYGQTHLELYPDRIAFDSGRPVMVFPRGHDGPLFDGKAVVAWDGGRAAARALADAMAILEDEKEVEIVSVGRSPLERSLPGFDVRGVLERHNVAVRLTELPRPRGATVAEVLVDHCTSTGASLLVMGAYEHSPLREDLVGGVTHDIALNASIPVLMSH